MTFGEGKESLHEQDEELPCDHEYELRIEKGTAAAQRRLIGQEIEHSVFAVVESHDSNGHTKDVQYGMKYDDEARFIKETPAEGEHDFEMEENKSIEFSHRQALTGMVSIDDIPDEVIIHIMTLSSFGAGSLETVCPASRFSHVSKKWHRLYEKAKRDALFETNELCRVTQGLTICTYPTLATGAGNVETILDSWEPVPRTAPWWTSHCIFEGGHWRAGIDNGTNDGPFYLREGAIVPTLVVNFDRPVTIRGVSFWARNKPRLVYCFVKQPNADIPTPTEPELGKNMLYIPKALSENQGNGFYRRGRLDPSWYAELVAQKMPQGKAPTEIDTEHFDLPSILPEPLTVNVGESFCIRIFASQERGWVGINNLLLFE